MLDKEYLIEKLFADDNEDLYLVKVSNNEEAGKNYYVVDLHDNISKELLETFTLEHKKGKWIEKEGNETAAAKKYGSFIDENT